VFQNIGIPDGVFNDLEEADCRFCHEDPDLVSGDTHIPDRHHNLMNSPIQAGECSISSNVCIADSDCPAGETCRAGTAAPDTDSDNDGQTDTTYQCLNCHIEDTTGGIITLIVFRDCLVCHQQAAGEGSVHHLTATASGVDSPIGNPNVGDCTPCHSTLVDDVGDGHIIPTYDPSLVTPTRSSGDGLPLNSRGNGAGACDYCHDDDGLPPTDPNKTIYTNQETHHGTGFGPGGAFGGDMCSWCHSFGLPFEEQIRVCEGCHGFEALHNIAVDSDTACLFGDPGCEVVIGGEAAGYSHVGNNDDCWGCHGFLPASAPGAGPVTPYLFGTDVLGMTTGTDTTVTLNGSALTNLVDTFQWTSDITMTGADGSSVTLTPDSITSNQLTVTVPGTTAPGNYAVRAVKGTSAVSNPVVIAVVPEVVITDDNCNRKKGVLTISGSGFGDKPAGTDAYVYVEVDGQTVEVSSWSDTQIKASVSSCSNKATIVVNALMGSATNDDSGGGGKPPKPCKGKKC
jgi:Cys-rich repeat protein